MLSRCGGAFHHLQIRERQFGHDGLDVGDRVDAAVDVDHVLVFEAAHDIDQRIGLADVGEKLVAQAFTLAGAGDQSGDVDELDDRGLDLLWLHDVRQLLKPRVGHFDDAHVRLDGAERIVLGGDAGLGQGVEQGGLADVGQSDDAALQGHG